MITIVCYSLYPNYVEIRLNEYNDTMMKQLQQLVHTTAYNVKRS